MIVFRCVCRQEGETPVHLAAELTEESAHGEFEDTDLVNCLLDFDGDLNIQTRLVSGANGLFGSCKTAA